MNKTIKSFTALLTICLVYILVPLQSADVEAASVPTVNYQSHVQNLGWQSYVRDGAVTGTFGRALRVESFRMYLSNLPVAGGISYTTHVQNIGWQAPRINNQISGTTGRSLRIEAMSISLTGQIAKQYDVYYRTYIQNFGWLGWANNGQSAGSEGKALRMEAIEIKLVKKGATAPPLGNEFVSNSGQKISKVYYLGAPNYNQYQLGAPSGCEGTALLQAEQTKGRLKGWSLRQFLDTMPRATTPYNGFVGSPYEEKYWVYSAMYPAPLTSWAKRYGNAANVSGASTDDLIGEITRGNPSVVWVTINFKTPNWGKWPFGWAVNNNHAVTLDGWDPTRNMVHVSDSISGSYWISKGTFESVYNERKYAVLIH